MNVGSHVLRNVTADCVVATRVRRIGTPWGKAIGLLGRSAVGPDEGVWIERCSAIHTIGMRATIDLLFFDANKVILKIVAAVPPQRLAVTCRGAAGVVELGSAGDVADRVRVGDRLVLE